MKLTIYGNYVQVSRVLYNVPLQSATTPLGVMTRWTFKKTRCQNHQKYFTILKVKPCFLIKFCYIHLLFPEKQHKDFNSI